MKIEKLTENKIRIIMKQEDLKDPTLDLHTIMTRTVESQGIFREILARAKKEFGFDIDGHKLLIEAFSSSDEVMVFTITKYAIENEKKAPSCSSSKNLKVKRKNNLSPKSNFCIHSFNDFDEYCSFCISLKNNKKISTYGLVNLSSLYVYEDNFYLVLSGINLQHKSLLNFFTLLSEFGTFYSSINGFEYKLKEYGHCLMKKNAISTTIKYFA